MSKLGVDLGTSSIGIAKYIKDDNGNYELTAIESSIFDEPVVNDEGSFQTKNSNRRNNRLIRTQRDRKIARHKKLRYLFSLLNVSEQDIETSIKNRSNIFALRSRAVDSEVTLAELCRILAHINNSRGYKGNLKSSGTVGKNITALNKQLADNNLQTVGQLWYLKQRNSNKNEAWKHINISTSDNTPPSGTYVSRDLIENEFELIWQKQAEYHKILNKKCPQDLLKYFNKSITNDSTIKDVFYKTIFYQRPIKWDIETIGRCPINKVEKRAAQASDAFQKYRIIKQLQNIRIVKKGKRSGEQRLSLEQIQSLYETLINPSLDYNENAELPYNEIYKLIYLDEGDRFSIDRKIDENDNKGIKGNQTLISFYNVGILNEYQKLTKNEQNILINFLANQTDYASILNADKDSLTNFFKEMDVNITSDSITSLINFVQNHLIAVLEDNKKSFMIETGRAPYGETVLKILLENMLQGKQEHEVLLEHFQIDNTRAEPKGHLAPISELLDKYPTTNPIIIRTLKEYKYKVEQYVKHGELLDNINIELSRDLKNSLVNRQHIEKEQQEYAKENNEIRKELAKYSIAPSTRNIMKYRLRQEAGGKCVYCGQNIGIDDMGNAQIDHIIPTATGGPNRYFNKVLSHNRCNSIKCDLTPYQAYERGVFSEDYWRAIVSYSEDLIKKAQKIKKKKVGNKLKKTLERIDLEKKAKLLITKKTAEELFNFADRQSNETAQISKMVLDWSNDISDKKPTPVRGALTAHLRHIWGLDTLLAEIRIIEGKPLFSKKKVKNKNQPLDIQAYKELYFNYEIQKDEDSYFYDAWQKYNEKLDASNKITLEKFKRNQKNKDEYKFDKRCDHRHHAIDAAIIGLCDRNLIADAAQYNSKYGTLKEVRNYKGEIIDKFCPHNPYSNLRNDLKKYLINYVVWHKPDRHPNKAFFEKTAYGIIKENGAYYPFVRKPLEGMIDVNSKDKTLKNLQKNLVDGFLKDHIITQYQARIANGYNCKDALLGKESDLNDGIFYQGNKIKKVRCYFIPGSSRGKVSENFLILDVNIKGKQKRSISYEDFLERAKSFNNGDILPFTAYNNNGFACYEFYPNSKKDEVSIKAIPVWLYQQKLVAYQKQYPKAKRLPLQENNIVRVFENETLFLKKEKQFYFVGQFMARDGLKLYPTTEIKTLTTEIKTIKSYNNFTILRSREQLIKKLAELQNE